MLGSTLRPGEEDDPDVRSGRVPLQPAADLIAIHHWHHDIDYCYINFQIRPQLKHVEHFLPTGGR